MTDRYSPDEPIIGASYPPSGPVSTFADDGSYIGASTATYVDDEEAEWDDGYDEYDPEYDEDYDDFYGGAPARQPMFYVFIGLAANKFLAKLGSDFKKPDGLTLIPETGKAAFLAPLA